MQELITIRGVFTMYRTVFASLGAIVLSASITAGCTSDTKKPAQKKEPTAIAQSDATVTFAEPGDGIIVGSSFNVKVETTHFEADAKNVGKKNRDGRGHFHFALDDGKYDRSPTSSAGAVAKTVGTEGKYSPSTDGTVRYSNIPDGPHKLVVYLVNNDHSNIQGVEAEINFTVAKTGGDALTRSGAVMSTDKVITGTVKGTTASFVAHLPGGFTIDGAAVGKKSVKGKGHLHWQLDDGKYDTPEFSSSGALAAKIGTVGKYSPAVAPAIVYKDLPKGQHKLILFLVNNDHTAAGKQYELTFTVG